LAERLGEYLVKAGRLTEAHLEAVLQRQVTMGGRLGTNLIELGYLTEQELTNFLSKKLNIPSATAKDFENIDPGVVKLVPAEVAKKYSMMPLRKDRNTLVVAMADPTDFESTNELAFITSVAIRPYVATEARVQYALETYYGIIRQLRYISVLEEERGKKTGKTRIETEDTAALLPDRQKQAGTRRPPSPEELEAAFKVAKQDLVEVTSREEVIAILLRNLSILFDRTVFFVVKKGAATGFDTLTPQLNSNAIRSLNISLNEASIFRDATERRDLCYLSSQGSSGALDPTPGNQRLIEALGGPPPREVLVAPVIMKEQQVVALLYGDNLASPRAQAGLAFIKKLMDKASVAFLEILILQKKMLEL
jgi:hypothetical protein